MVELKLLNTLEGEKQVFVPINPDNIRVYACGPTVYDFAHIGNARMAVVFDLLVRILRHTYPKVTYVSNITDIDDKIIEASRKKNIPIKELTEKFTKIYNDDMHLLGVCHPDIQPKATEHIQEMIDLIGALVEHGYGYAAEGHVMFNVPAFPAYGRLSGRSRKDQIAGARVEVSPFKKDPADFVMWKPSTQDQPGWDSPWGYGRPGWHIECSAMSEKHLGLPFDIHGGGADLKFPHHENEIAQSCCALGKVDDPTAFAKYWIHNGFLTVESEKMSKSLGNITLVHDLLQNVPGEVLRLALLSAQYRQPLDWSQKTIISTKSLLDRFYNIYMSLGCVESEPQDIPDSVMAALKDDLNTPLAIAEMNKIAKEAASAEPSVKAGLKGQLEAAGRVIGILQEDPEKWLGFSGHDQDVERLICEREEARKAKDYARADEIRSELDRKGIIVEDASEGSKWRKK